MEIQIVTDYTGRVLAVLSYCPLALAQETARQYARVLGCATYRNSMRVPPSRMPVVGEVLPEFVRAERATS